ncbi:hypothetical protein [Streptomyces orinoci]|uniref:Uncharacterized protein n=1 Tax=Streptomyces orinoci TaxID=67339 RepID=A0ABV3JYP0_STRON|nr:hypothetical protein [Streptomyces orinoci]
MAWDELAPAATCRGETMRWEAKHDRDAFKEVWLLFDNEQGRFTLHPGESVWIEYAYTELLEVQLAFPAALDRVVWGTETSMTALHARYRLEWRFRARPEPDTDQGSSGD